MYSVYRKFTLFLLIFAMATGAYSSAVAASNLLPTDCMMHMMDDDESTDDKPTGDINCECSLCDTQCQRCGLDIAGSASLILLTAGAKLAHATIATSYRNTAHHFDSVTLTHPSPPPIT